MYAIGENVQGVDSIASYLRKACRLVVAREKKAHFTGTYNSIPRISSTLNCLLHLEPIQHPLRRHPLPLLHKIQ